jgi:hypothetical protein
MRIVFRPEAQAESIAAFDWYEARAQGLGVEFVRALDVALAAARPILRLSWPRR